MKIKKFFIKHIANSLEVTEEIYHITKEDN